MAKVVLPLARLWLTSPEPSCCLLCNIMHSADGGARLLGTPGLAIQGRLGSSEIDYQFGFLCSGCHELTPQPYRVCDNAVDLDREIGPFLAPVNDALGNGGSGGQPEKAPPGDASDNNNNNNQTLQQIGTSELHISQGRCAFCNRRDSKLEYKQWQQGIMETRLPSCPANQCRRNQRRLNRHKWWTELNLLNAAHLVKRTVPVDVFLHQLDRSGDFASMPFCWACGQGGETELRCAGCAGAGYCSTICWLTNQEHACPHDCRASLWAEPLLLCGHWLPTLSPSTSFFNSVNPPTSPEGHRKTRGQLGMEASPVKS